eukprot:TRINITY_DN1078_c0_g3_i3.p1 TRINITY_DN1078_c0_g3~~TRINITY_DN1078_c0_g3_i3.p1  ORF type:complete len:311 (+),score=35.29 TRINITY_DN1078_c0_g3_i3:49-981(+)
MGCCLQKYVHIDELIPGKVRRPPYHKDKHVVIQGTRYKVTRVIGEGCMSAVYKCRNQEGGVVAIKKSSIDKIDHARVNAAVREAELLGGLQHRGVVLYLGHAVEEVKGRVEVFLCLEYARKSLLDLMNEWVREGGGARHQEVLRMFRDVAEGVEYLHSHSPAIIHRDLKAENILLSSKGNWKICDFGSATTHVIRCTTRHDINSAEMDIEASTTPAYRSPEQCDLWTKTPLDTAVDIWALGVLLFYAAYLVYPFTTPLQILNLKYVRPQDADPSPHIDGIIKVCLQPYERRATIDTVMKLCRETERTLVL